MHLTAKDADASRVDFTELHRHPVGMTPPDADLTPLGALLEEARTRKGLSKREAARQAGISEGRWRQVVTGIQKAGDVAVPVNPRANTVAAMARAVDVKAEVALAIAGFSDGEIARFAEPKAVPGDWEDRLARVEQIANNPDRSPGLRAWAGQQAEQIRLIIAAAEAEEEAARRGRAS
jgi:transcriptional regulator with XRE-family HTH domain